MSAPRKLLILAGTAEARALAEALARRPDFAVRAAMAGVTPRPAAFPVPLHRGRFGGVAGLAAHLRATDTACLIDATHPFAARMSAIAAEAAATLPIPHLHLRRDAWTAPPGADWQRVASPGAALAHLPAGARVFWAAGPQSLARLTPRPDLTLFLRAIGPPDPPVPGARLILARPPFSLGAEQATLAGHAITHLVAKDAGGADGLAKLEAAAALAIPVLLIDRPPPPPGPTVATVADALAWLETLPKGEAP